MTSQAALAHTSDHDLTDEIRLSRDYIQAACCKRWRVDAGALLLELQQAQARVLKGEAPCPNCRAWVPLAKLQPDDVNDQAPRYLCPRRLDEALAQRQADHATAVPTDPSGVVYLLRNPQNGYIKIGRTINFALRKPLVDRSHGVTYEVVHVIATDWPRELERRLHQRYAKQRRSMKELFALNDTELAALQKVTQWNLRGPKEQLRFVACSEGIERPTITPQHLAFQVQETSSASQ